VPYELGPGGAMCEGTPGMAKVEVLVSAGAEGASDEWLGRLARRLRGDERERVLCIVPTRDAVRRLQERVLLEFDVPGIFGRPIRNFYELAADIAAARRLGGRNISPLQRALMLEELAARAAAPTLERVQHFPGFAMALGELIGELKTAMVEPADLSRAVKKLARSEAALRAKLTDLLALYERYQSILTERKLHDAEGLMWHAVSVLEEEVGDHVPDEERALAPASSFFFHGFRTFNRVQLRLLRAIAGYAEETFIHLRHDPRRPEAFAASARTLEALRQLPEVVVRVAQAGLAGATSPEVARTSRGLETARPLSTDLGHVAANLFRPDAEARPSDQSLVIMEAGSPAQEADQVAREICRLVAAGHACHADIAVITRDDEARQRFAHLLARYEVPVRGSTESLGASAVGGTLLSCLRVVRERWPATAVGTVLKSPCLPGEDAVARARAEVRSWELGVREGRDIWFSRWPGDDTLGAREQALGPLKKLEDDLRRAASVAEMAAAVRGLVEGFERPGPQEAAALRDDEEARRKLDEVIDEVESIAGLAEPPGRAPAWETFCANLERAITQAGYQPGARPLDAVVVHDAKELAGQAYRVVFAVNMLEKVFPAQVREDPFLRDRERRLLAEANPKVELDLSTQRQDEERLLFWRTVTSASERVYLSYPAADERAKESLPSFYLKEVRRLFVRGTLDERRRRFSDLAPPPREAISRRDWAACVLHGLARYMAPAEQAAHAAHYNTWLRHAQARLEPYLQPAPPYADVLCDAPLLAALEARDRPYHPSELESYLACPYMYYCGRLLELSPVKREIAPADYGTLAHEALRRLYREWRQESGKPVEVGERDADEVVARARELLAECLAHAPRFANLPAAQRDIERRRIGDIIAGFVAADLADTRARGLRPAYFELEFGGEVRSGTAGGGCAAPDSDTAEGGCATLADPASRPDCLDLGEVEGRRVLIAGRIDRVDLAPDDRAVIVDYKLGKGPRDLRGVDRGLVLQAPLYALAVREVFGREVAGAEYASIRTGRRTGLYGDAGLVTRRSRYNVVAAGAELQAKLELAAAWARECVGRIRRGEVPRGPRDEQCPPWCGYRGICGVDAWTLRAIQARRGRE